MKQKHIPILYMAHPFVTNENKDTYITRLGLAAITEMQGNCKLAVSRSIEHKLLALAITRSFVNDAMYKGRPVITEDDVKQACRWQGLVYRHPSPTTKIGAWRVALDKAFIQHSLDAPEGHIANGELKRASEDAADYEMEYLSR